jgi:hypothetical protein
VKAVHYINLSWSSLGHNASNIGTIVIAIPSLNTTVFTADGTETQLSRNYTIVLHYFTGSQLTMFEPSSKGHGEKLPETANADVPEITRDQARGQAPPYAYDHGVLMNYNLAAFTQLYMICPQTERDDFTRNFHKCLQDRMAALSVAKLTASRYAILSSVPF